MIYCRMFSSIQLNILQGLYSENCDISNHQRLWWALYHSDRYISLLLGLPYGCIDAHYGISFETIEDKPGLMLQRFLISCSICASKVIDRNLAPSNTSPALTRGVEEQLNILYASMPSDWWNVHIIPSKPGSELGKLREKLLEQFYFFQIRVYLHLPFIFKSCSTSVTGYQSRMLCAESSRQLLRRYLVLRTKVEDEYIFDCASTDFTGFMAAVILLICLAGSINTLDVQLSDEDARIMKSVHQTFNKLESEGYKHSTEYLKTISMLRRAQTDEIADNETPFTDQARSVSIPFFRVLINGPFRPFALPQDTAARVQASAVARSAVPGASVAQTEVNSGGANGSLVDYPSSSQLDDFFDNMDWEVDNFTNFTFDDVYSWVDSALLTL